jgi:hypothetical protein
MNIYMTDKYENLEKDVNLLLEGFTIIQELVKDQQDKIDTIEDFILVSKEKVNDGKNDLIKSNNYNNYNYYLITIGLGFLYLIL